MQYTLPGGLTFAPSSDPNDHPDTYSLYITCRGIDNGAFPRKNSLDGAVSKVSGMSLVVHSLFWENAVDTRETDLPRDSALRGDPLFNGDFGPEGRSPALDAGVARIEWREELVIVMPPSEYTGRAPDLGAFESY